MRLSVSITFFTRKITSIVVSKAKVKLPNGPADQKSKKMAMPRIRTKLTLCVRSKKNTAKAQITKRSTLSKNGQKIERIYSARKIPIEIKMKRELLIMVSKQKSDP